MKLVNRDPFTSGSECEWWIERNCDRCWKATREKGEDSLGIQQYTKCHCSIQRDIATRMWTNELIAQRTIDICQKPDCPYRQEHRPRKKYEKNKNEPKLFEP